VARTESDEIMHFYLCEDLVVPAVPAARDEDEQIEPATVSVDTVREMIADGRVADMKTVAGMSLIDGALSPRARRTQALKP